MPQPIHHHQNDNAAGEVVLGDTHEETQRGSFAALCGVSLLEASSGRTPVTASPRW